MRISDWSSDVCSSDLGSAVVLPAPGGATSTAFEAAFSADSRSGRTAWMGRSVRSEEHTSELQSLMRISYAVFCLKKKKKQIQKEHTTKRISTSNKRNETYI